MKHKNKKVQYCNIEEVSWIDEHTIAAASGRTSDNQDFQCLAKDQSIHMFTYSK